jgi:hypothetical protein
MEEEEEQEKEEEEGGVPAGRPSFDPARNWVLLVVLE